MDEKNDRTSNPVVAGLPEEREPPLDPPIDTASRRGAMDMVPGIPAGDSQSAEEILGSPDSELGGAVAADTTPGGETDDRPDEQQITIEDRERNTL